MSKAAIPVLAVLCLCSLLMAQEPAAVSDVAIDKLLDGVRVTVACGGTPSISSFVVNDPPAIVVDLMNATSKLDRDRIESSLYPVTAVTVQPSEATNGLRITIRLRDMVDHTVSTENGLVVVNLGMRPVSMAQPVEPKDQFSGQKLTLYVKDAEIADILRMIASQFNLNVLISQDVKSLITVRLADVPLRTAFMAVLKAGLCNMVEDPSSGVIIVKPEKKTMYGETETRIFDVSFVDADDASKIVAKSLSAVGNVDVAYRRLDKNGNGRTASLIVTDIPEAVDRIAQVIAEYDRPVPQIAIEAKFVETVMTGSDRYGIDWTLAANASAGNFDFTKDFGLPLIFNNMVLGKVDLSQFRASLEIAQERGLSRVLASPQAVTMDNMTATMNISTQYPEREVTTDPKTGLVLYTWKSQSIPVGIEVTPHVTPDGKIAMSLSPQVEAITGYVGPADDQRPVVSRRSAQTQIVVGDGEVAVIGGFIQDNESRNVGKIPLLGDIPILGNLFKKTSITHTKTDLMIFIIPHVLPAEG